MFCVSLSKLPWKEDEAYGIVRSKVNIYLTQVWHPWPKEDPLLTLDKNANMKVNSELEFCIFSGG